MIMGLAEPYIWIDMILDVVLMRLCQKFSLLMAGLLVYDITTPAALSLSANL
jgi:hypothetical protein